MALTLAILPDKVQEEMAEASSATTMGVDIAPRVQRRERISFKFVRSAPPDLFPDERSDVPLDSSGRACLYHVPSQPSLTLQGIAHVPTHRSCSPLI